MPASEAANSLRIATDSPVPAVESWRFQDVRHKTQDIRIVPYADVLAINCRQLFIAGMRHSE